MTTRNEPVANMPYFLPLNEPPVGTLLRERTVEVGGSPDIAVFQPLTIRGVEFKNRIWASPMCQYSSQDGSATDWHLVHLGGLAARGIGAICIEATSVVPEGRITPEDAGLWKDEHMEPLKRIVTFVHGQGCKIGIQLAHAGRKASTLAPWVEVSQEAHGRVATKEAGGWPEQVYGPSAIPFSKTYPDVIAADAAYMSSLKTAFKEAVQRCKQIGLDFIEIHGAHGYLLHSFCSPISNKRNDSYGGSLENRMRLSLEVAQLVRDEFDGPLFYRVSASDWSEGPEKEDDEYRQWGIEQSCILAGELKKIGVDLIDVSSGGVDVAQKIPVGPGYQVPLAAEIKKSHPEMLVGAVGLLTKADQIEEVLQAGHADVIFVAREVLRDVDFPLRVAEELGVVVQPSPQYARAWTRMMDGRANKK